MSICAHLASPVPWISEKKTSRWWVWERKISPWKNHGRSAIKFLKIRNVSTQQKQRCLEDYSFFPFLIWENRAIFQGHFDWFFGETSAWRTRVTPERVAKNGVEGIDERRGGVPSKIPVGPKKPKNLWCHWGRSWRSKEPCESNRGQSPLFFRRVQWFLGRFGRVFGGNFGDFGRSIFSIFFWWGGEVMTCFSNFFFELVIP